MGFWIARVSNSEWGIFFLFLLLAKVEAENASDAKVRLLAKLEQLVRETDIEPKRNVLGQAIAAIWASGE